MKSRRKKPNGITDITFKKTNVIVESSASNFSYMLFGLKSTCDKYAIDYEKCLILMYLEELGIFAIDLKIFSDSKKLTDYSAQGLIISDNMANGKNLYKLSKSGLEIVENIKNVMADESKFINLNRAVDVEADKKIKGALFEYFDYKVD